jgi:hypothetical protein
MVIESVSAAIAGALTVLCGINSFFSFFTTVKPPFFGTQFTGLTHSLCGTG